MAMTAGKLPDDPDELQRHRFSLRAETLPGAEHRAVIASLIETRKLDGVEPIGYLADILIRNVNGRLDSQIYGLLSWVCIDKTEFKLVAREQRLRW